MRRRCVGERMSATVRRRILVVWQRWFSMEWRNEYTTSCLKIHIYIYILWIRTRMDNMKNLAIHPKHLFCFSENNWDSCPRQDHSTAAKDHSTVTEDHSTIANPPHHSRIFDPETSCMYTLFFMCRLQLFNLFVASYYLIYLSLAIIYFVCRLLLFYFI